MCCLSAEYFAVYYLDVCVCVRVCVCVLIYMLHVSLIGEVVMLMPTDAQAMSMTHEKYIAGISNAGGYR